MKGIEISWFYMTTTTLAAVCVHQITKHKVKKMTMVPTCQFLFPLRDPLCGTQVTTSLESTVMR